MSVLSYFNLNPKAVSVDEAAEKLVKDLLGEYSDSDSNSSAHHAPRAETSAHALTALQLLHRWEPPTQDRFPVTKEAIRSAKKVYLLQNGEKNNEKAADDFDQKVETLLVAKLTGRMRLFYIGKVRELDRSLNSGEITKSQYEQELNLYLDEVKDQKNCSLQMEVKNALSMIDDKDLNVVNGLCYLFNGKLRPDQEIRLAVFDAVLNEVIEQKFDSSDAVQAKATTFRRAFIAEARRQLGSRFSEDFSAEYSTEEKQKLAEMESGKITYKEYIGSMRNWIATQNLQIQVGSVLGDLKDRDNVIAILSFVNYKMHGELIKSGNPYRNRSDLQRQCSSFDVLAFRYSQYHSFGPHDKDNEYNRFLSEAERQLVRALPTDIKNALNDNEKNLKKLVADQYINEDAIKKNNIGFFSSLVSGENNKKSLTSDVTSNNLDELGGKKLQAKTLAKDGLLKSIRQNSRENDVLEALIMCWGGFVNNHRGEFSLYPLCEAKNAYLSIGKSEPSGETLMHFNFHGDFSVEPRAISVIPEC